MDVGIGLPATIRGVQGAQILEWARRAEGRGFSSLGTIDRIVYGFLGDYAGQVAAGAAKDAETVRAHVDGFAAAGCGELVLFPCDPDPAQVDRLADALA
jgi:hypothetical protein